MIAFKFIAYDLVLTVISLVAAIVISGIALYLTGRGGQFKLAGWLAGSLLAGLGVCVMHYMGIYPNVVSCISMAATRVKPWTPCFEAA